MLAPQTRHLCHLLAVWLLFCSGASAWAQSSTAERSLSQWRQDLVEAELDVRRETAIATRGCDLELQKQLVPEFIELLRYEKDGQIRLAVLDTVADMGPVAAEAIPALMVAMQKNFGGRQEEERHQDFRAALALSKIGPAAVEALRNLTGEKSANLRSEAALALGRIGPPAAAATAELIGLLADDDPHVRSDASTALGFFGPAAIKPLLIASRSEAAQVRTGAINSLGRCNAGEAQEDDVATACVDALKDSEPTVRAAAVRAIDARLAEEQVLQTALTEALQDAENSVRVEVVNALAHRPRLLETLEPRLVQLLTADDDGVAWHAAFLLHLRGEAGAAALRGGLELAECRPAQIAQALALIGPPMVEPLTDALDDPQPRVRQAAALALGQIRPLNEETVSRLAQGLADENRDVQAAFLESISKLGSRARPAIAQIRARHADLDAQSRMRMIDVLIAAAPRDEQLIQELLAAVNDPDPRVQQHTINAIQSTGTFGRPAVAVITEKLRSPDRQVQSAAAAFIGSQGRAAEEAVPHLIEMLDDPDAQWRIVLIETLGELGATAQAALPKLSQCVSDPLPAIRAASVRALANLQLDPLEIQPQFAQALQDPEAEVRTQALSSIRRLGRHGQVFLADLILLTANEQGRDSVTRTLERFERSPTNSESIGRLVELLEHPHLEVRLQAIKFLGLGGANAKRAEPQLQLLKSDADESIRAAASLAIERIEQPSTAENSRPE